MENKNNFNLFYTRMRDAVNYKTEKLLKEQLNLKLTYNPNRSKNDWIKKIRKPAGVDSSYYLG